MATFTDLISARIPAADRRPRPIGAEWVGIVIHHTGLPKQFPKDRPAWERYQAAIADWLSKKDDSYLSAHYQIGRFGEVIELVDPETHEAFHAGVSSFWHWRRREVASDWNRYAIGIELLGDGNLEPYTAEQYAACAALCRGLMARFTTIAPNTIVGHEMIAPGRKNDPGRLFEWRRLFALIYGA